MDLFQTCSGYPALEDAVVLLCVDIEWFFVDRALIVDLIDRGLRLTLLLLCRLVLLLLLLLLLLLRVILLLYEKAVR